MWRFWPSFSRSVENIAETFLWVSHEEASGEASFYLRNQSTSSRTRPTINRASPSTETLPRTRLQIKNSTPAPRTPYTIKLDHSNHVMALKLDRFAFAVQQKIRR